MVYMWSCIPFIRLPRILVPFFKGPLCFPSFKLPITSWHLSSALSVCIPSFRYNRELLELELQPAHEDVFAEGPTTVDSYLQEVHTSTVVSAIQVIA